MTPKRQGIGRGQHAHAAIALHPDRVLRQQRLGLVDPPRHHLEELADLAHALLVDVHDHAADPDVGVVHPQPGDRLEHIHQDLALAEAVQHDAHRAQLEPARREPHQVRGDPVQLAEEDADHLRPRRRLDPEQALDRQAVAELVEEGRQVVGAGHVRDALHPRPVLGVLLDPRVQVADDRLAGDHRFAVQLQQQPQHPVRRRVLRTHVDDHGLLPDLSGGVAERGVGRRSRHRSRSSCAGRREG